VSINAGVKAFPFSNLSYKNRYLPSSLPAYFIERRQRVKMARSNSDGVFEDFLSLCFEYTQRVPFVLHVYCRAPALK